MTTTVSDASEPDPRERAYLLAGKSLQIGLSWNAGVAQSQLQRVV